MWRSRGQCGDQGVSDEQGQTDPEGVNSALSGLFTLYNADILLYKL